MHTQHQPSHSTRRPVVWLVTLVGLVALLLGATACSDGDDGGEQLADTESIDQTSSTGESDETDEAQPDDTTEDDGSSDRGSGEVLGTTQATLNTSAIDNRPAPIRIDVVGLERHGDLVELALVLTNEAPDDSDSPQDFYINTAFGDNLTASGRYDASGIGLVDGEAQRIYLPAYDSEDVCLCTDELGAVTVAPGGTLNIDATYGGVPDDLELVDVRVPGFPAVTGVAVR